MTVAIVKYNAGNIYSVVNALKRLGVEPLLTDDAEQLKQADKVLFPGQGHAGEAMDYLKARRLDEVIRDLKQPVFGICVGQQLLCKYSEEGDTECIGIFDAEVKRFQPTRHEDKVPCMGWQNLYDLKSPRSFRLFRPFVLCAVVRGDHCYCRLHPALLCLNAQGQFLYLPVPSGKEWSGR